MEFPEQQQYCLCPTDSFQYPDEADAHSLLSFNTDQFGDEIDVTWLDTLFQSLKQFDAYNPITFISDALNNKIMIILICIRKKSFRRSSSNLRLVISEAGQERASHLAIADATEGCNDDAALPGIVLVAKSRREFCLHFFHHREEPDVIKGHERVPDRLAAPSQLVSF